jgi:SAM-dependent methyltransferase
MDRGAYDQMQCVEQDHWWFAARREILAGEIARLPLPKSAHVLEVGCGCGGNLEMLASFGKVSAVEPDAASRAWAAQRGDAVVREGALPDRLPDFGHGFDLVAALDVVEHVAEDGLALRALCDALNPGGFLVATVPAYSWMWSEHDERHHHERRYHRPGFRRLAESAGLVVRRGSYFNTVLFPVIAAARLASAASSGSRNDDALPRPWVNRLLKAVFTSERGLLQFTDLPFGVSILMIAQRPA